jgi:hypothetical protein
MIIEQSDRSSRQRESPDSDEGLRQLQSRRQGIAAMTAEGEAFYSSRLPAVKSLAAIVKILCKDRFQRLNWSFFTVSLRCSL